jgi:DNA-binding winged helix-turn-helix (wHTH) protein
MGGTTAGAESGQASAASEAPAEPDASDLSGLRVEVIGVGAVRRGDAVVAGLDLGGRRARVALAVLALTDGPVSADRLAALIWSNEPPPTWPAALRGVIRSLRTALGAIQAGGQRVIATTPSGYRLAPGVSVDLDIAEATLAEASTLAGLGRHAAAIAAAEPVTGLSGDQLLPGEDASWLAPHRALADALALRALELAAESAGALGGGRAPGGERQPAERALAPYPLPRPARSRGPGRGGAGVRGVPRDPGRTARG